LAFNPESFEQQTSGRRAIRGRQCGNDACRNQPDQNDSVHDAASIGRECSLIGITDSITDFITVSITVSFTDAGTDAGASGRS